MKEFFTVKGWRKRRPFLCCLLMCLMMARPAFASENELYVETLGYSEPFQLAPLLRFQAIGLGQGEDILGEVRIGYQQYRSGYSYIFEKRDVFAAYINREAAEAIGNHQASEGVVPTRQTSRFLSTYTFALGAERELGACGRLSYEAGLALSLAFSKTNFRGTATTDAAGNLQIDGQLAYEYSRDGMFATRHHYPIGIGPKVSLGWQCAFADKHQVNITLRDVGMLYFSTYPTMDVSFTSDVEKYDKNGILILQPSYSGKVTLIEKWIDTIPFFSLQYHYRVAPRYELGSRHIFLLNRYLPEISVRYIPGGYHMGLSQITDAVILALGVEQDGYHLKVSKSLSGPDYFYLSFSYRF